MQHMRASETMRTHNAVVNRTARYWTIGAEGADAQSIWFVLHGYGQLATEFLHYFQPLVEDAHRIVVAPEGLSRFYTRGMSGQVGASWMTREGREQEISDYVAMLDQIGDSIVELATAVPDVQTTAVDPSDPPKRIVLGFSQGAATACRWLTGGQQSENFGVPRLVLWAGAVPPDVDLARLKSVLGGGPLTLVVGSTDPFVNHERLDEETSRLGAAGIPLDVLRFNGGHHLEDRTLRTLARRLD